MGSYYPFGMRHRGYNSVVNGTHHPYGFMNQEENEELGLGWLMFRHRNYMPEMGRFFGVDPISEQYPNQTNYQFASNNPIWKVEIEGLEGWPTSEEDWINGLGYGVDPGDGTAVQPEASSAFMDFMDETFKAVGEVLSGVGDIIHDGISSTVESGVSTVMGTAEPDVVMSNSEFSDAIVSGSESDVYNGLEEEAAAIYNATPEMVGDLAATGVEILISEATGGAIKGSPKGKANYSNLTEPKNVGVGKKFTQAQKARILEANRNSNNGVLRSDMSGKILDQPVQSKRGIPANMNQAEVDHIQARSRGEQIVTVMLKSCQKERILGKEIIKWN